MKKLCFIAIIILLVVMTACDNTTKEELLNDFADPRSNYDELLDGYITYDEDTAFFSLLPISGEETDHRFEYIRIEGPNDYSLFARRPKDEISWITAPDWKNKEMTEWEFLPAMRGAPYGDVIMLFPEDKAFPMLEEMMHNGKVIYHDFASEEILTKMFMEVHHKSPAEARRLARVATRPIFSADEICD